MWQREAVAVRARARGRHSAVVVARGVRYPGPGHQE